MYVKQYWWMLQPCNFGHGGHLLTSCKIVHSSCIKWFSTGISLYLA